MLEVNRIVAVFMKECKDALKNKAIIMMLILLPIFSFVFSNVMEKEELNMMLPTFLTMHVIMIPIVCMASIIGEEKEKGTLRSLMIANVSPMEYLIGISVFILIIEMASSCLFLPILEYDSGSIFKFLGVIFSISLCSVIIGAVVGIFAKNQISVGPMATPVGIIFGMIPMIAQMNDGVAKISKYMYSQISYDIFSNINHSITNKQYFVYLINLFVFIVIFYFSFRNNKMDR